MSDNKKLFFKWDDKFETGHAEVDKQHKQLFELGNDLFSSSYEDGKRFILEFYKYTRYHFNEEEKLMEAVSYKDTYRHRVLHEELISGLNQVSEHYFEDSAAFEQFKVFVYQWITQHIMHEDIKIPHP